MFALNIALLIVGGFGFVVLQENEFEPYYDWKYINFTWPSYEEYQDAVDTGRYIPVNNIISGVKQYEDRIFISLPRSKDGAPVTLAYALKSWFNKTDQPLVPYPSWEMNVQDDCDSFQNVPSMEIDRRGIMWVIDGGDTARGCRPKIVLLDLNNEGEVIQSYEIPNETSVNDIVIDEIEGGYAYISDTNGNDPGIIVYSRADNRSWKVSDSSMLAEEDAAGFEAQGIEYNGFVGIDGIALSQPLIPDDPQKSVYYCALTGYYLYAISAEVLRDEELATGNVSSYVRNVGRKPAQSDGMVVDSVGNLYYGLLPLDGIARWNTSDGVGAQNSDIIEQDSDLIKWPDGFGYDNDDRHVLVTSVNYNTFSQVGFDPENVNIRILRLYTNARSYLWGTFDDYE